MLRRRNIDEAAAKLLLKLSKKSKGQLDMGLAKRVLGPMGWKFEQVPTLIGTSNSTVNWAVRVKLKPCTKSEFKTSVDGAELSFDGQDEARCAVTLFPQIFRIVSAPPARPELGVYYATPPSPTHVKNGRYTFESNIWLGGIRWTVTAPNGASKHFDVSDLEPVNLAPLWTFFYKHGLDKQAAAKLAETPGAVETATQTRAERERVEKRRSSLPTIEKVFREITEKKYNSVVKYLEELFNAAMGVVLRIQRETGKSGRIDWHDIPGGGIARQMMTLEYINEPTPHQEYRPRKNAKEIAHKAAVEVASAARDAFIEKNTFRISEIARLKGAIPNAKVERISGGTGYDSYITFTFPDGSHFGLQNQTIWKRSPLGLVFAQFPTTFHDVVLPGGKKMSSPSEARMTEVFAGGKTSNMTRRLMR